MKIDHNRLVVSEANRIMPSKNGLRMADLDAFAASVLQSENKPASSGRRAEKNVISLAKAEAKRKRRSEKRARSVEL